MSQAALVAANLRRVMARLGMTYDDVVTATGLDERTLRGIARASHQPQARTLHRLATGLGVEVDELFAPAGRRWGANSTEFDAATNAAVSSVVAAHPQLFAEWTTADHAELASRFGVGGALTEEGVLELAEQQNAQRELLEKAKLVLYTRHGQALASVIEALYDAAVER